MQELSTVLTSLSVAAGLALGVERILEVLKHFMELENNFLPEREHNDALLRAQTSMKRAQQAFDALREQQTTSAKPENLDTQKVATVRRESESTAVGSDSSNMPVANSELSPADSESEERFPAPRIPLIPATPQSRFLTAKCLFLQLAAAGLGMISAYIFDLRLLSLFLDGYGVIASDLILSLDVVFTGIVIGGGSQPIHLLIRFLTERNLQVAPPAPVSRSSGPSKPRQVDTTSSVALTAWRDIDYRGGVQPQRLENAHLRPGEPNLIVYHHTAMASSSTFQDVVNEFLVNKKWLTGYHCVIMPDGGIRPFCRWDRYGNHAKGLNARSLGLAFHGNFHTEATDKYANADGRYGNQAPTPEQLQAGARVVALWLSLYDDISLDFQHCILPHREAMPRHTVCPGSNFPVQEFQRLISRFHEAWAESGAAQQGISAFKQLNYVYAT